MIADTSVCVLTIKVTYLISFCGFIVMSPHMARALLLATVTSQLNSHSKPDAVVKLIDRYYDLDLCKLLADAAPSKLLPQDVVKDRLVPFLHKDDVDLTEIPGDVCVLCKPDPSPLQPLPVSNC